MAELILVKAANPEWVALWERHADHPDNEVYVAGEDAVLVALTPMVQRKLDQGALIRIEPALEEKPGDDAPTTDETPNSDEASTSDEKPTTDEAPATKTKKAK